MPKKELVDYIKKEIKKGVSLDKIKDKLLSVGHSQFHVSEAFEEINKKKNKLNYAILFMSLTIFIVVVILSYQLFISQLDTSEITDITPSSDLSFFSNAINQNDFDLCYEIEDDDIREDCLNYEPSEPSQDLKIFTNALNRNDPLLCDEILNDRVRNDCKNSFT